MSRSIFLMLALFAVGCGPTSASTADPHAASAEGAPPRPREAAEPREAPSADASRYLGAPAGTSSIAHRLMARHTEDLPDEEALRAHEGAEAALRWLATDADRLVLRVRALQSLRFFSSAETRDVLLRVLEDAEAHPTLRAAAATGTASLELTDDLALRAALDAARAAGDPRIERAVDERLAGAGAPATPGTTAP